ncbi:hypothetical protein B0J14DRAFT_173036 [Halenospora varia]|nr:hypothetical protein B0J14DRAFT_173036 [Halenospora varia]
MPPRRPHRKSRNGCQHCKKSHIKCGEEHPVCTNCIEYNVQCEYLSTKSTRQSATGDVALQHSLSYDVTSSSQENSQNLAGSPDAVDANSSIHNPDIDTSDLELLHHFTTVTYLSLSNVPAEQRSWQTAIVNVGLRHTFLLRGILALSALHLSYLRPKPEAISYVVKASTHQDIGLAQFRRALSSIDSSNFDAVLAFSVLLPLHSLAIAANSTFRSNAPEQDIFSTFLKSIHLFRSVNSFMLPSLDVFTDSMLLPLLQVTTQDIPEAPVYPGMESLDVLESACSVFCTSTSASIQAARVSIYSTTISQLRTTFAKIESANAKSTQHFTIGIFLIWTITVSDDYMQLLNDRHPSAMAILAHFATMLHGHDDVW